MRTLALPSLLLAALPAAAQTFFPPPLLKPEAATHLYPNGVVHAAAVPRLMWRQGGLYATQQQPPAARFFRLCLYDTAAGKTCDSTELKYLYAASAPELHATPVYSPLRGQAVAGAHRFSFEVPSGLLQPDRPYRWKVGACKTSDAGTCTYSGPALLHPSTRNLTVTGIEEGISTDRISMTTEVANTGTTDVAPFVVASVILPAEYDEAAGRCATVADTDLSYIAVTATGDFVSVLPSDDVPVVGIPLGAPLLELEDPPQGLGAGSADLRAPVEVLLGPGTPLPASFLLITRADNGTVIDEYDESDNNRAECHTVYP